MSVCTHVTTTSYLCGLTTLDGESRCADHGGPRLARHHTQCTPPNFPEQTGTYLSMPGHGAISPIFDSWIELSAWCRANGWRERRLDLSTTYIQDRSANA